MIKVRAQFITTFVSDIKVLPATTMKNPIFNTYHSTNLDDIIRCAYKHSQSHDITIYPDFSPKSKEDRNWFTTDSFIAGNMVVDTDEKLQYC